VPLDRMAGKDRHKCAACNMERRDETGGQPDTDSGDHCGDQRIARIHNDRRCRHDFNGSFAEPERPARNLATALIAQPSA